MRNKKTHTLRSTKSQLQLTVRLTVRIHLLKKKDHDNSTKEKTIRHKSVTIQIYTKFLKTNSK